MTQALNRLNNPSAVLARVQHVHGVTCECECECVTRPPPTRKKEKLGHCNGICNSRL